MRIIGARKWSLPPSHRRRGLANAPPSWSAIVTEKATIQAVKPRDVVPL